MLVIYLGKDEEGDYRNKWITLDAKNKTEANREGALKFAEFVAQNSRASSISKSKDVTFNEILNIFLGRYTVIKKLSPQTIEGYERNIRLHIRPELGEYKVSELRPYLGQFYTLKEKEGYSPTTVDQMHKIIHKSLEYAVSEGIIETNVARGVEHPTKDNTKKGISLDEKELAHLLGVLDENNDSIAYLPALIAAWTGLRIGEVLGLPWRYVDIKNKTLSVNQTMRFTKNGPKLGPPKSRSGYRTVPIPMDLLFALRKEKEKQTKNRLLCGSAYHADLDLVCCRADGSPIHRTVVSKTFSKIAKQAGFKMRFHDLRHTYATLLSHSGVGLDLIKYLLGHSTIAITVDTYTHVLPDALQKSAVALREIQTKVKKHQAGTDIPSVSAEG